MAMIDAPDDIGSWTDVVWVGNDPPIDRLEARYDAFADELVVRWDGFVPVPAASDFFDECDAADIGVVIDWRTGHVIGVHVYPLLNGAVAAFPHWVAVAQPNPHADAVAALAADVRRLFDRYGLPPREPAQVGRRGSGPARQERTGSPPPGQR